MSEDAGTTTTAAADGSTTTGTDVLATGAPAAPPKPAQPAAAAPPKAAAGGDDAVLSEIKALAEELGITPGQLKGRLEASRKWEQRSKDNAEAAQLKQQMAQLLGLGNQDLTPEQMKAALGDRDKQLADRDSTIRSLQVERSVADAARAANADIALLLPALTYDGVLKDLDPKADDFAATVKQIVETKVRENPKYLAAAAFPDLRQGNQGQGAAASDDPNAWLRKMAGRP